MYCNCVHPETDDDKKVPSICKINFFLLPPLIFHYYVKFFLMMYEHPLYYQFQF